MVAERGGGGGGMLSGSSHGGLQNCGALNSTQEYPHSGLGRGPLRTWLRRQRWLEDLVGIARLKAVEKVLSEGEWGEDRRPCLLVGMAPVSCDLRRRG